MKFEKQLNEIYGFIVGDGTYSIRHTGYGQMTFYNYNLELVKYLQSLIYQITKNNVRILSKKVDIGIEYSVNIPAEIKNSIIGLGFDKEKVPNWIKNSKYNIYFLKAFFECEGSTNGSQIMVHQIKRKLLEDCIEIANKCGLSAHVHNSSKNRRGEYYLAIENGENIQRVWGKTIKSVPNKYASKGNYYYTKRAILRILNKGKWTPTSKIEEKLKVTGIEISPISNSLLNKHLNPLYKTGIIKREYGRSRRDRLGRFKKAESKWKIYKKMSDFQLLNFPYKGRSEGVECQE